VQDYRAFFALLDWSPVERWQEQRSSRGRPAHPQSAYLKAFLLRIREGMSYTSQLRRFLVKHPLLVIELGFRLHLDPTQPYGFDVEKTVPSASWLREQLHRFDDDLLQTLLQTTVAALQHEIPGFGETVAFDVKHIYAWVRENNPRVYVQGKFDVTYRCKGDPHCRLGVKKSNNQEHPDGSKKEKKQNTFWYVYEMVAHGPGIAAIPLNRHGHEEVPRDPDGTPRCSRGLRMSPVFQFRHTNGFVAQRFRCPLLFPTRTGETCAHAQFSKGKGCVKDPNWQAGGLMRALLDRDGPLYHAVYNQRTACERINSKAQALGIERPKVRNICSVRNLNTLIYLVINVRALAKAKSINKGLLQMN